ncbi:MAG: toprim domain-containing protein [Desulfomonilaceae bacterium]
MEIGQYLTSITNLLNIIEVAYEYGLGLDEHGLTVCFEGHDFDTPTLQFDEETQSFNCLWPDCRLHGGVIDLVQELEGIRFIEAVNHLAERVGVEAWYSDKSRQQFGIEAPVVEQIYACLKAAARIYAQSLDEAMEYLEGRGISRGTAETHLIGRTRGKDDVKKALLAEGFEPRFLVLAGLMNREGDDFFRDRVIVPIRSNGSVVRFYGRALDDENTVKHLRMRNDRTIVGDGLFNWNARRSEIIVTEGIFDALSLIDKGFKNAVATFGTQGIGSDRNLIRVAESSVRKLYFCYDGDKAGQVATARDAYQLEDMGIDAKIIDLGTHDPNEFMLTHSAKDFEDRLSQASSPVYWEIGRVDPEWRAEKKIEELENVFRRCKKMRPLEKEAVIDKIVGLGFYKKVLREHIAKLPDEASEDALAIDLTDCQLIHPALDFADKTMVMTVPQLVHDLEKNKAEWVPWMVTSGKEFFPVTPEELRKRKYFANSIVGAEEPRYTQRTIDVFLNGAAEGDLSKTFMWILELFKLYTDFPDPNTFLYLTAWVVGTYFHPIFNYYPYLHFTGTKNVGKSKTMKLMSCLSFNGTMSVSVTSAAQFRIIEALRPTLFMDESEDLNQKGGSDKRALLLGGYEAGSSVLRAEKEGESYKVRRLGNYGPRAFASIEGLEDTLASRTIQIHMERSYKDDVKEREINLRDPAFQEIRDQLFLVAMNKCHLIEEYYVSINKPENTIFGDREYNLFKPILTVGHAVGTKELVNKLIDFANLAYRQKVDQYNETAEENVLLRYLVDTIKKDDWFPANELHAGFIDFIKTNALEMHRQITRSRLGTLMKKLNLVSNFKRSSDRTTSLYFIETAKLFKVAENYLAM